VWNKMLEMLGIPNSIALSVLIAMDLVVMAKVVHGTIVRNNWGINLKAYPCSRCGTTPTPGSIRAARSLRQVLLGGRTCGNCGCELDKWGREIPK
jgi:hypothetical protein